MDDWIELDRRCVWHPYTHRRSAPAPLPVASARGVWLETPDGRRILDGISSWWVNVHGHSHPRLDRALSEQLSRLQHVVFAGVTHEAAARLAARLVDLTPRGLDHVFYSDDGSTAVEVALKLAVHYWQLRGEGRRTRFVALEHGYHGDTFGAMAASGVPLFHEVYRPLLCEVLRVPSPCPVPARGEEAAEEAARRSREELERVLASEGNRVAAVIVEPMLQGAGGMLVWPRGHLEHVRRACDRHGTLLIADEVLTGFGRTGRLFACEHDAVRPDIICLAKALTGGYLPLSATLSTAEIHDAFDTDDRRRTFFHGHSFTANPLACAVALESLAVIEAEDSIARVQRLERVLRRGLEEIRDLPAVASVRSIGGMAAIELSPAEPGPGGYLDEIGPRLHRELLERGIYLRPLGNVLYFLPPYVITDDEARWVLGEILDVLGGIAVP